MTRKLIRLATMAVALFLALAVTNVFSSVFGLRSDDLPQQPLTDHAFVDHSSSEPFATREHGEDDFLVGVGKGDITGPVAEINFMGYAEPAQLGSGVRQRLYSRAFIIGNIEDPQERLVYLVLDAHCGDTGIRNGILEGLQDLGREYAMYGQHNVAVTGTHSHSGPGGFLNYLLPQITSKGFHKPTYQAIVDGAVASIVQAHERVAVGRLSIGEVELKDANINRSPSAYLANPAAERARYASNSDTTMTVLRLAHTVDSGTDTKDVGILTWFPTHGTSMYANNTLATGDNKGVAAWLFEKSTGDADFVAGFSQANLADVSPNVLGAYCESGEQKGELCDFETSLCGGVAKACHSRGPYFGRNDAGAASCYEIGMRQYQTALDLVSDASAFSPVKGGVVRSLHQFVDLSNYQFELPNGTEVRTCSAALGYSFAAGTSDYPGNFDFKQGQPNEHNANPMWSLIGNRIHKPNSTMRACHQEKVILFDVGESSFPYDWSPNIVDVQLFRVGQLFMIVAPGEVSTMAGRRWKEAIQTSARTVVSDIAASGQEPVVVLGGPANTYTHYITTPEEYTQQRFEGASTLYGPYTLDAHINLTMSRLPYLSATGKHPRELDPGPMPPILVNDSLSFISPVVWDRAPLFKSFGDVAGDVRHDYKAGETVSATFVGANPRNNLRLEGTFAAVERLGEDGDWHQVRDDGDWSLVYEWKRASTIIATSEVTISWETKWETGEWREDGPARLGKNSIQPFGESTLKGKYRLRYYGDARGIRGGITPFQGVSGEFLIN